jgi:hypothetical protein
VRFLIKDSQDEKREGRSEKERERIHGIEVNLEVIEGRGWLKGLEEP